jgi:hypothetical protein
MASARYPDGVAGLITVGMPARNAGASFSSDPQTGKLNALICTGDAGQAGVDVLADEAAVLGEGLDRAVDVDLRIGQLAATLRRVGEQHADAAVDVDPGVVCRRTGARREA